MSEGDVKPQNPVVAEAHEVGIRMISDLMEQAGWRTAYLGADVPHADVIERVAKHPDDTVRRYVAEALD